MSALLVLETPTLAVEPGAEAVCTCRVRNTSTVVDQVSLRVLGPAAAWTVADPPVVSLFPDAEGTVALRMRPPADVPAGPVHFGVMLVSATDPGATVVEEGTVQVGAFVAVTARIVPRTRKGRSAGRHKLILRNTGNAPAVVRVSGSDPDDVIRFKGLRPAPMTLAAGSSTPLRIRYRSTASHMTGPAETHGFTLSVVPEGGATVQAEGAFVQRAAISGLMIMVGLGVIAIFALVLILHSASGGGAPTATLGNRPAGADGSASPSTDGSGSGQSGTSTGSGSASTSTGAGGGSGTATAGGGSSSGGSGGGGATAKPIGGGGTVTTPKPTSGGAKVTPTATAAPTPTPVPVVDLPAIFTRNSNEIDTLVGGAPHAITTAGIGGTWSPDGKSLAFYHAGKVGVGTYDGNVLSGIHDIVTTQCNCSYATWSPDGAYIAFYASNGDLDVVSPTTGVVQTWLANAQGVSGWPGWTANSANLVFPRSDGLYAVPRGGGAARLIVATNATSSEGVTFSSDGVLMGWSSGGSTYVANVDTGLNLTNPHQVGSGKEPSFERTKETFYVIYSSDLWKVDANGSMYNGSNLTNSGNCDYSRS